MAYHKAYLPGSPKRVMLCCSPARPETLEHKFLHQSCKTTRFDVFMRLIVLVQAQHPCSSGTERGSKIGRWTQNCYCWKNSFLLKATLPRPTLVCQKTFMMK